jgi:DNA-binding IclR family transcriptional regulator
MRILELLAFAPLSIPQLAATLHAHPRTVQRVVLRLVEDEYLTCIDERRRLYVPTMRLVALAGQIVENAPLARQGRPYARLLHERTNATAHVVVPSYQAVVCLVHCSAHADDLRPRLRELVPAHSTAGGKVLLAWRDRWRENLLAEPLERFTDRTIVDAGALRRALTHIREQGHAVEDGEYQDKVYAVAAPVLVGDTAVAALTLTSTRRADVTKAVPLVTETAQELAEDLGAVR